METLDTIAARFDERAPRYDESLLHTALAAEVARFVEADGTPRRVLDVATGTGLVVRALASRGGLPEHGRPGAVVGIDASRGMLAVARAHLPGVGWVLGDAQRLPFEAGAFDLVTCVTGLHLMADPVAALAEWGRVLAPRGRLALATFATDARAYPSPTASDPHARVGSPELLDDLARRSGLVVNRRERWEHVPEGATTPQEVCLLTELAPAGAGG